MAQNPVITKLGEPQVIQRVYDEANDQLRVTVNGVSSGVVVPVTIVDGDINGMTVVATYEIPFSNINGSGGALYQVTASTPAKIALTVPNEQTGVAISLYVGATLLVILAPGQDNEVNTIIPAGSSISVRATDSAAPVSGSLFLSFIG